MFDGVRRMKSQLNKREMAELCALADGSLPAERREAVEARVASSPELREVLERQRRAVRAMSALAAEQPSESLRQTVLAERAGPARGRPARGRRLAPRIALAGVAGVAAATVLAIALIGGPGGPTVAEAASLAARPATAPAPSSIAGTSRLAIGVEGVAFPDFSSWSGWRPLGVRRDRLEGRAATTVFYGRDGRRIAYVIVSGDALPRPAGGQTTPVGGVEYQTLRLSDRLAVTWRRGGHTCILLGQASRVELISMAGWSVN